MRTLLLLLSLCIPLRYLHTGHDVDARTRHPIEESASDRDRPDLLNEIEVARWLRCSVRYLGYLRAHGELPFVRIGSQRIVYRREDIEEFIARRVVRKGVGDAA
jgi:hypothetical protein